jgi:hypothetical protein
MKRKKNHTLTSSIKQHWEPTDRQLYWHWIIVGSLEGHYIKMTSELMYRRKKECRKNLKAFMKRNF